MTGCANPPLVIGSRSLPEPQQFDAWHAAACGRGFELSRGEEASGGFPAEMRLWRCGPFGFARISVPPGRRWRGPGHVRAEPAEHWAVALVARGWRRTRWGDAVVERRPGTLAVWSLMEPFEEERGAVETIYVFAPRDAVPGASDALDALRNRPLGGGPAALFSDFMVSAVRALPDLDPDQVAALARATRAMLGVLAAPPAERRDVLAAPPAEGRREEGGAALRAALRAALLARCERLVARHVASASLGPAALARLGGVSRSGLYRLFEPHGGVAAYVQRERLRRAAAALGDPADARRVSQVAEACGFFDPSVFSRLFRRRFGATPSEFRRAALADLPPPPRRAGPPDDASAGSFAGFLRSL